MRFKLLFRTAIICLLLTTFYSLLLSNEGDLENKLTKAKTLVQSNKLEEATSKYREIIKEYPEQIEAHRTYQNFMRSIERGGELKEEYQRRLTSEPTKAIWHYLYGRLLKGTELESAFKKAINLQSDFFWAHYGLAHFYKDNARWAEAIKEFKAAHTLKPDDEAVSHDLALAYFYAANIRAAQDIWQQIIKVNADNLEARLGIGLCFKAKGSYDAAIKEFETVLSKDEGFWKVYEPLIQCYHAQRDYPNGKRLMAQVKLLYQKTPDKEFAQSKEIVIDWLVVKKTCLMVATLPLQSFWSEKNREVLYNFKVYYEIKRVDLENNDELPEPHQIIRVEAQRAKDSDVPLAWLTWRLKLLEPIKGAWQVTSTLKEYHFHIPSYPEVLDDIITYPQ